MRPKPDRGDPPPPNRPRLWHWLVPTGTGLGAFVVSAAQQIAGQGLANLAAVSVPVVIASLVVLVILGALEVRGRRARERLEAAAPPPAFRASARPRTIVNLPPAPQPVIRQPEVTRVARAVAVEGAAVLILGRAGVGTSTCAVQAANLTRRRGVPGPWYLDLNPDGRPLPYPAALAAIEDKLAGRGLIVLDNAVSVRQVQPLLRVPRRCRLLIAGGPALAGLQRIDRYRLSEPSQEEAAALFLSVSPATPPAGLPDPVVTNLVDLCGRQPYAVRALAYWIMARGWGPEAVLAALDAEVARGVWYQERQSATIALLLKWDLAYWDLSPRARRLFRLLALVSHPLPRDAIAALAGSSGQVTDRLLSELATTECVDSDPEERYLIRPLLVPYARMHLRFEEPRARRIAALGRTLRHLARCAEQRAAAADGTEWFTRHRSLLDSLTGREPASTSPPHPPARMRRWRFRLSVAMATWYATTRQLDDWAATCGAVLATQPPVPRSMAAWAYNELGVALRRGGDPAAAERELHQAAALRSRRGIAQNRTNLGLVLLDRDDLDTAIEQLQIAVRHRSRSDRAGKARSRLGLGVALQAAGHTRAARHQLVLAANGFKAIDDLAGYGVALSNLMLVQWSLGEYLDAAQARKPALDRLRATGDRPALAAALLNAAATLVSGEVKDPATARRMLTESLELRSGLPDGPGTGRCHLYLGDALLALGEPGEATAHWSNAHRICLAVGDAAGAAAAGSRSA